MKHQRMTPATTSQHPTATSWRNQNATSQPQQHTQCTFWDFVHPILQPNHPEPVPPPPHNNEHIVLETPNTHDTPPATPIPIAIPDSQFDPQLQITEPATTAIQQPQQSEKSNRPWGNTALFERSTHHFRVVSKNTGTLNPHKLDMVAITEELMSKGVSVFVAQETNIHWTPATTPMILSQAWPATPHVAMATSASTEETDNWYKPGGTLVLALNHCTSRIIARGTDTPLGRWSYLKFVGKVNKCLIIVSVYQVCNQKFDAISNTASAQQIRILQSTGIANPNPRKIFLMDLIKQINKWHTMKKEVLLCMDTNDHVDDPKAKLSWLFLETDLSDLHYHCYPSIKKAVTYQHGSRPIDLMAGSPLTINALVSTWMCPFNNPPTIKGDHCLMGLDFDLDILFGTSTTVLANLGQQGAKSRQTQMVNKYCKWVLSRCTQQGLAEHIAHLLMLPTFNMDHHQELEQIDTQLTRILTKTDHECCPTNNAPWSP